MTVPAMVEVMEAQVAVATAAVATAVAAMVGEMVAEAGPSATRRHGGRCAAADSGGCEGYACETMRKAAPYVLHTLGACGTVLMQPTRLQRIAFRVLLYAQAKSLMPLPSR